METVRYGYNPMHPDTFREDFELAQSDLGEVPLETLCPYLPKNQQLEMIESFEESLSESIHTSPLQED